MTLRTLLASAAVLALVGVGALAFLTHETWQAWGWPTGPEATGPAVDDDAHGPAHASPDRVKLSPQARANLRLAVRPVQPQTYRSTVPLPGVVVERRARGDRAFVAPVAGVVQAVAVQPGDTVRPGDALLTLRVNSEALQASQTELYKTAQEVNITEDQVRRLEKLAAGGSLPMARITELRYQLDRLNATRKAYRADLSVKGLTPQQIDQVEAGTFLKDVVVRAPGPPADDDRPLLEVEALKVQAGEQVQAGQLLGHLANHQNLLIEGRGFREDTELLERTAALGWPLTATFLEEKDGRWPALSTPLTIQYLANTIDPTSQTFPFYVPLANQSREYTRAGKTYRIWRFRPGQRVQLGAPVEEFTDVFVVPAGAVVREGPDAYVFRQNGGYFDRKPVHVVHEDARQVVLANDGSLTPGSYVVHNAADALNRALAAAQADGEGGGHDHHGHSH